MKLNSLLRRWVFLVVLLLGLSSAQSVQPPVSAAGPHFLPQLDSRPPLWRTLVDPSGLAVPTAAVQGENLYLLFLSAAPGTNVTTSYTVQVNGHPNGVVTLRWFNGVPYIGVNDSARLLWYPQIDLDHNIIDFADCVRLDFVGKTVYASGGAQSGWAAVFTKQPPLAHNVRRDLVPLLDVAPRLGVRVTLDPRRRVLTVNSTPGAYVAQYPYLDSCRRIGVP